MSKLGVYWSVMHRRPGDYDYFRRLQPGVIKIMDGGPNDYAWVRQNLPKSLVIARDWALSEQHDDMRRNPVGTGIRHAREWRGHADRLGFDPANTLVLGINEPKVWDAGVPEALRQYTIALCDEAARLSLRVGAMQLSVGWPGNNGPDTPPNWSPWHGVEEAIRRGNHMLVLHEYWADQGPGELWGWWAGRALKCPWQVPIVIGECGIDMYVKDGGVQHESRGWRGRKSPEAYAADLADYVGRMSADGRFMGACVFATDFANREWASFDTEPAHEAILSTPIRVPATVTGGVDVYVPIVNGGGPTPAEPPKPLPSAGAFERCMEFVFRWEGGLSTDPHDPGNYVNGKFVGTKYGISAAAHPDVDIANLTKAQATEIYRRQYWEPSGADRLPWPDCLAVFDLAVNGGVGRAKQFVAEVGTAFVPFMARRIDWYTRIDNFERYGRAWLRRCADLMREGVS